MTVETLQCLSMAGFVLSGVMAVVTLILFIIYRIPVVIGDLSGANARKAIEAIRRQQKDEDEEEAQDSVVVEYEIGFWTSGEIIDFD